MGLQKAKSFRQLFEIRPTTTIIAENIKSFFDARDLDFSVVFPKRKTAGVSQLFTSKRTSVLEFNQKPKFA
jgi:hypothetical protein